MWVRRERSLRWRTATYSRPCLALVTICAPSDVLAPPRFSMTTGFPKVRAELLDQNTPDDIGCSARRKWNDESDTMIGIGLRLRLCAG